MEIFKLTYIWIQLKLDLEIERGHLHLQTEWSDSDEFCTPVNSILENCSNVMFIYCLNEWNWMIYRKYITFEVMLQVENYLKQLFVQIEISWEETFYLHCVFDGPGMR